MDVDKRTATKRLYKYFCSDKHANHYAQMKMDRGNRQRRRVERRMLLGSTAAPVDKNCPGYVGNHVV